MKKLILGLALSGLVVLSGCPLRQMTAADRFHLARGTYANAYDAALAVAESNITPEDIDAKIVVILDHADLVSGTLIKTGKTALLTNDEEGLTVATNGLLALSSQLEETAGEFNE